MSLNSRLFSVRNKKTDYYTFLFFKRLNLKIEVQILFNYSNNYNKLWKTCFYSYWQRGTNENTNGLIRQYYPKGTDFSKVEIKELKRVERLLNNRPRKCLGYKTPFEVYKK